MSAYFNKMALSAPLLSLLRSNSNTGLEHLTIIFTTMDMAIDVHSLTHLKAADFLPPPYHIHSSTSPPSNYASLLSDVLSNHFLSPTLLIINATKKPPAVRHNTLSCSTLISDGGLVVCHNHSVCGVLVHDSTVTSNSSLGSLSPSSLSSLSSPSVVPFTHPQQVLSIEVGAESGGARTIHVDTTLGLDVHPSVTCIPALFDQFLAHGKATPPPPPHVGTFSDAFDTLILPGARVHGNSSVSSSIVREKATLTDNQSISSVTLFECSSVTSCPNVSLTVLEPHSSISSSTSSLALLAGHTSVSSSHTLFSTIVGPSSHLSSGETHASILGPLSNQHHQSLLISCIAPLGRINVGYGANVGSNHTGRSADQEVYVGEGCFLGLTICVKFPLNLSASPYSIVAAGVSAPPSRVAFPFSLIAEQLDDSRGLSVVAQDCPPRHLNQLHPGWLLTSTLYTIARNDSKFAARQYVLPFSLSLFEFI